MYSVVYALICGRLYVSPLPAYGNNFSNLPSMKLLISILCLIAFEQDLRIKITNSKALEISVMNHLS